jgi:hypothetical protein
VIGAHQLPDPQGERDVGAEPPVGVRRCVVGGRRVGGPNGCRKWSRACWNPASSFLSNRGYHPSRRSSRRTDGRQRSDGEPPRPSATGEGCRGLRSARPGAGSVTPFAADLRSTPTAARPPASAASRCPLG